MKKDTQNGFGGVHIDFTFKLYLNAFIKILTTMIIFLFLRKIFRYDMAVNLWLNCISIK